MIKRSLPTAVALLFVGIALLACQTAPVLPPPSTPPAVIKTSEPTKPPTEETVRVMVANCFNCHGPNGQSSGTIPSLNTLTAEDIASRLKSFKTGSTTSTVMGRHAKGYNDAEIDAMSKYIAGLK